jgi:hypothetical protein
MNANEKRSDSVDRTAGTQRRSAKLVVLVACSAITLAACGGSNSPTVASLVRNAGPRSVGAKSVGNSSARRKGSTTARPSKRDPTALVDQWATCMRGHGDPTQADPVIDSHGVINIVVPPVTGGGPPVVTGGPEAAEGTCSQYLAAAQRALRAANPVSPPPNRSELISYVNCMRTTGVPGYPYPTGEKANFNGTGVDPNSPQFERANKVCGDKLNLPAWWVNGWGPPGDVSVRSALLGGVPHSTPVPAGSNGAGSGG